MRSRRNQVRDLTVEGSHDTINHLVVENVEMFQLESSAKNAVRQEPQILESSERTERVKQKMEISAPEEPAEALDAVQRPYKRIGESLQFICDYFSYAFITKLDIQHVLIVIFQTELKEKISAKKIELEAAVSSHANAKAELDVINKRQMEG